MDGNFDLNKPGWYTPQNVADNDFLNDKLEDDKYGQWYSVKFVGDAETYLWMAKTAPNPGEKYYGHLEKTSSGKSVRFKKDKLPDGQPAPVGANKQSASTDESIARAVALKAAVDFVNEEATVKYTLSVAQDFVHWLQGKSENVPEAKPKELPRNWDKLGKKHEEPLPEPPEDY